MASFFEPKFEFEMNVPKVQLKDWDMFPDLIPQLGNRFKDGCTFGEFNIKTLEA